MSICEVCGNDYDTALQVTLGGETHTFDCFECAIHALAPLCSHCGVRIIGHGMQRANTLYCCGNCASREGVTELKDRA